MSPISISMLESWSAGGVRDGAAATVRAASDVDSCRNEFTSATDIGDAWRGEASDAAKTGASSIAATCGGMATSLQTMGTSLSTFAQAIETAQSTIANAKTLIHDRHGLPVAFGPDGRFEAINPDVATTNTMVTAKDGVTMAGGAGDVNAAPGWPPDITTNMAFYQGEIDRMNNEIQTALAQLEAADAKNSATLTEQSAALVTDARQTTSGPGTAFTPGAEPWAAVAGERGLALSGLRDLGTEGLTFGDGFGKSLESGIGAIGDLGKMLYGVSAIQLVKDPGKWASNWGDIGNGVHSALTTPMENPITTIRNSYADFKDNPGYFLGGLAGDAALVVGTGGVGGAALKGGTMVAKVARPERELFMSKPGLPGDPSPGPISRVFTPMGGTPIPAGRMYMPPADVLHRNGDKLRPHNPDEHYVVIHGSPDSVGFDDGLGPEITMNPKQFADDIRSDPKWKEGKPIFLNSCSTGQGENCFAQGLAHELGVPVTAPNTSSWTNDKTGEVFASDARKIGKILGVEVPVVPHNGSWTTFQPTPK